MAAKKPTVYLDTNVISAYWYDGRNELARTRRAQTRDWWESERHHFVVWASAVTEMELSDGTYRHQADCVTMVRRLKYLPLSADATELAQQLIDDGIVPDTKPGDAYQMALCAVHAMDYLLTWNYAHLANPIAQAKLEAVCRRTKLAVPYLVSPELIPKAALGQTIRRHKQ